MSAFLVVESTMSYLTDRFRADSARALGLTEVEHVPGQMFEDVLRDAKVQRRTLLRGSFGATLAAVFGGAALTACGGDDDTAAVPAPADTAPASFSSVSPVTGDAVVVPEGYTAEVLFSAGDAVMPGATPFTGTFLGSADTEKFAGGGHDGMHFYEIPGIDPNKGGLLAINHESPDAAILMAERFDAATATPEQKKIALSAVGVSVIEIELKNGKWEVKKDSPFNKRYTGNTVFNVSGPAAAAVGATVVGTLNNCASGTTPWGTYLTCEETTDNYLDPTQPVEGYGWVVEIDPQNKLTNLPVKRTALGRFDHENTAYLMDEQGNMALYMGDDGTPGCIYKFVPSAKVNLTDRTANGTILDNGTLYAAKFNADGTGQWIALVQGTNNLTVGATDPGLVPQSATPPAPTVVNFVTQADVLINTKAAARVAGATQMDRPEWVTVGPDKKIYITMTKNSGRKVADAANPRAGNPHGHIIQWTEDGNAPGATSFKWEIFMLGGDARLADAVAKGNIQGDTFSSPDGLRVDPLGRLWVQTDADTGTGITNTFGNNAMYHVDAVTKQSKRFLVGPDGCEITGIAYTPDMKTFFVNIQHPGKTWPSNVQGNTLPARSSTVVVRRTDGQVVGV
jgi:secreted PhoX family phosphatase